MTGEGVAQSALLLGGSKFPIRHVMLLTIQTIVDS